MVGLYIFGWLIVYKNTHLKPYDVAGDARLTVRHPTKVPCTPIDPRCKSDFTPMQRLSYCKGYSGEASDYEKHHVQEKCRYLLSSEIQDASRMPNYLFFPTMINSAIQKPVCEARDYASKDCESVYELADPGDSGNSSKELDPNASPEQFDIYDTAFVADIERFTMLIDMSYQILHESGYLTGGSGSTKSFVQKQGSTEEIKIPGPSDDRIPGLPSVFRVAHGDIMSLEDLLVLAGVSLDDLAQNEEKGYEDLYISRRSRGGMLTVVITLSNFEYFRPFGGGDMKYTVSSRMEHTKVNYAEYSTPLSGSDDRLYHIDYGVSVQVVVAGTFYGFHFSYMVAVLTSALGLLAIGSLLTDKIMVLISEKYALLKAQRSMNVNDADEEKNISSHLETMRALVRSPGAAAKLDNEQVLSVLLQFERRLNRLDGCDESNIEGDIKDALLARSKP
eukprot:TRINITY_DN46565_c0_g1_i1.p1 TRINITY_DN46565_c0_g1~~TRINITY_DN46565_c0_g1_i1.p1  ORF type:complete len:509 (+),score=74.72 TRINITY_DN46565_c0_g1_i1:185-1528(+)